MSVTRTQLPEPSPVVLPRVCISSKLDLEVEPEVKPMHTNTGCRYPKKQLHHCAKCLPMVINLTVKIQSSEPKIAFN